jgi:hypothetical protein
MRTTVQQLRLDDTTVTVFHELEAGEVWADFGMEQPTGLFSHRQDWPPTCPLCVRVRETIQRVEEMTL